jgi:beta-aspartyl-peptidase (threonine type)
MVHGGSGNIKSIEPFNPGLLEALHEGQRMLKIGKCAVDVVLRCMTILENNPRLNAGTGSSLNERGEIEMEAAIMDGSDLSVGAVAGIHRIKNPISVAELIRNEPDIVKLIGQGAFDFAIEHGIEQIDDANLITDRQRKIYNKWLENRSMIIDGEEEKLGTVGTVVIDKNGWLAAATSTGGLLGKKVGRVGDTSTIGAGTYADNNGAISCTGKGEDFVRLHIAGKIADLIGEGYCAKQAAQTAMNKLDAFGGRGGVIVVDKNRQIGSAKTQSVKGLAHGAVTSESDPKTSLIPDEIS